MSIRTISTGQLRRMGDQEGLILQGCGGDPQEWLDGINEILAQECILKKGAGFEEAYTFRHDGMTCMLFPFKEDMELDVGRLAAWRLASYSTLYIHIFLLVSSGDIHIIPNNAQGGIVAPTLKDSTAHFLRLFLHSILPECL